MGCPFETESNFRFIEGEWESTRGCETRYLLVGDWIGDVPQSIAQQILWCLPNLLHTGHVHQNSNINESTFLRKIYFSSNYNVDFLQMCSMFCTHELQTYVKVPFEICDQMHIYWDKRYSIYICLDFPLRHLSSFQVKFVINHCRIIYVVRYLRSNCSSVVNTVY